MSNRPKRLTHSRRLAAGLGMLILLGGCAPVFESYHYISLESYEDAQVIQRGRPTPGEFRWSVGEIPILYEITRESYALRLDIDPDIFTPVRAAVAIRVRPSGDRRLRIEPDDEVEAPDCGDWVTRSQPPMPARMEWVHRSDCRPPNGPSGFQIRFNVVDGEGTVVAKEAIPYTVKTDGYYVFYDAV